MDNNDMKDIIEAAQLLADGNLNKELKPEQLHGVLADLAVHLEKIRQNFLIIDPNIKDTSEKVPETSSQLMDIDKTLSTAADRLMGITETLMTDHEKTETLLNRLLQWGEGLNALDTESVARITIDELRTINKKNRENLMDVFSNLSFQDLAGQKIKKMRKLIEDMEARLLEVLIIFGHHKDKVDETKRDEMLKGLKEGGGAIKQDLVDDIMKNLGL